MKATIYASPRYALTLSAKELKVLTDCSGMHYDSTCRNASRLGGFIYAANNMASPVSVSVTLNDRELQTCIKILEMPPSQYKDAATLIYRHLWACLRSARQNLSVLAFDVTT